MNTTEQHLLTRLLKYSEKYEISIQFWPDQTAVYINKDDVPLYDYGGDREDALTKAIEYLDRITGNTDNWIEENVKEESDKTYKDPRDNPFIGEDDSWIHDGDMGAR